MPTAYEVTVGDHLPTVPDAMLAVWLRRALPRLLPDATVTAVAVRREHDSLPRVALIEATVPGSGSIFDPDGDSSLTDVARAVRRILHLDHNPPVGSWWSPEPLAVWCREVAA